MEAVKEQEKINIEMVKSNKFAMICHFVESLIISVAYFGEFVKGARTLIYVLLTIAFAMIPPILEILFYQKNKDTKMIKHLIGYGFAALYVFVMLTTNNYLTFVYVIPMLVVITVYNDFKYSLPIGIGAIIVNVCQVGMFFAKGIYTSQNSAAVEIQILVMVLICAFQLYASKVTGKLNAVKMQQLHDQNEKTANILNNTMQISDQMVSQILEASQKVSVLGESMAAMKEAMEEVNSGSNDTAEAVQNQLSQTEAIQSMVQNVEAGAKEVIDSMNDNRQAIEQGNKNVELLVSQVNKSVESGEYVTEELSKLDEYMKQMNSIVDIIDEIATQTSLLALNASIEAARAGEAGKGFAVVASEISQMAQQTQNSTVRIADLIKNVSEAISSVIKVSTDMIEMIEGQKETTEKTSQSFVVIEKNSENVFKNSSGLADYVTRLSEANKGIVDSISTISAISEEVAAHASDTQESSETNNSIVEELVAMTNRLEQLAHQLNA